MLENERGSDGKELGLRDMGMTGGLEDSNVFGEEMATIAAA